MTGLKPANRNAIPATGKGLVVAAPPQNRLRPPNHHPDVKPSFRNRNHCGADRLARPETEGLTSGASAGRSVAPLLPTTLGCRAGPTHRRGATQPPGCEVCGVEVAGPELPLWAVATAVDDSDAAVGDSSHAAAAPTIAIVTNTTIPASLSMKDLTTEATRLGYDRCGQESTRLFSHCSSISTLAEMYRAAPRRYKRSKSNYGAQLGVAPEGSSSGPRPAPWLRFLKSVAENRMVRATPADDGHARRCERPIRRVRWSKRSVHLFAPTAINAAQLLDRP